MFVRSRPGAGWVCFGGVLVGNDSFKFYEYERDTSGVRRVAVGTRTWRDETADAAEGGRRVD
eukprot:6310428-Prymnesium_polylepis.1